MIYIYSVIIVVCIKTNQNVFGRLKKKIYYLQTFQWKRVYKSKREAVNNSEKGNACLFTQPLALPFLATKLQRAAAEVARWPVGQRGIEERGTVSLEPRSV